MDVSWEHVLNMLFQILKGMLFQILEPVLFLKLRAISKVWMQSLNVTGTTREIT